MSAEGATALEHEVGSTLISETKPQPQSQQQQAAGGGKKKKKGKK